MTNPLLEKEVAAFWEETSMEEMISLLGLSGASYQKLSAVDGAMKNLLTQALTRIYRAGQEDVVDQIEVDSEFVKEDAHDGNYGYFKVYNGNNKNLIDQFAPNQTQP